MDLVSLNIQRGRDHGLAPYNIWREQCGLKRFAAWEEMEVVMDKTTVSRLENIYEHVDDVDLFTGRHKRARVTPPVRACIFIVFYPYIGNIFVQKSLCELHQHHWSHLCLAFIFLYPYIGKFVQAGKWKSPLWALPVSLVPHMPVSIICGFRFSYL
jgi:hypothetical protein